jgi:tRNA(Arg) A34 adenosine deaminase TadA
MLEMLRLAAKVAMPTNDIDRRNFLLGCIGIRKDGVLVSAKNGATEYYDTVPYYHLIPNSHAEGRVLRKLGSGGLLYVARVSKKDYCSLAMARPCDMCAVRIKAARVKKVYYSINEECYGLWSPQEDTDRIFRI